MDQLHELDFCRLCSRRPRTGRFLNILNTKVNRIELRKIILDLLTVNVEESDVLSKIICFRCYRFLVKWFQTKKKLKKTEAILKNNPTVSKNLLAYAKFSAKKKQRLIILQQRLCKKAIENQLLMLNILEKMNELKEEEEETQNPPTSVATGDDTGPIDTNKPGFCICNQVEYGKMIACDNKECPHKWFHYECMNIVDTPKGKWLCNDCVTSSVE